MQALGEMLQIRGAICRGFWYLSAIKNEAESWPGWLLGQNKMRGCAKYKTIYL